MHVNISANLRNKEQASRSGQRGATLLETMIALFVLSVGILGILSMQIESVRAGKMASIYSDAAYLATSLAEAARMSPANLSDYAMPETDSVPNAPTDCSAVGVQCSGEDMAAYQKQTWMEDVIDALPNASGEIVVDEANRTLNISLTFSNVFSAESDGADETETFTLSTMVEQI